MKGLYAAVKNFNPDAFGRDRAIRKALAAWTLIWLILGSVIISGGLNLPVETTPYVKLNIVLWCISATFLFWFTGIVGCYFIYPLTQKS